MNRNNHKPQGPGHALVFVVIAGLLVLFSWNNPRYQTLALPRRTAGHVVALVSLLLAHRLIASVLRRYHRSEEARRYQRTEFQTRAQRELPVAGCALGPVQ